MRTYSNETPAQFNQKGARKDDAQDLDFIDENEDWRTTQEFSNNDRFFTE